MKKLLISVLILLLIVLLVFVFIKGIGFLNIKSINGIKQASNNLERKFNQASEISSKTYPDKIEELEQAIKKLKIAKEKYEKKNIKNKDKSLLGTVEVKTYKIHYLWTIIGNYKKDRKVQSLNLDLKSTHTKDVYDLGFTLIGTYTSITDFIYDIENDEQLNFEIKDFRITSSLSEDTELEDGIETEKNTEDSENTENTNTTQADNSQNTNEENKKQEDNGIILKATFKVEKVGITLD